MGRKRQFAQSNSTPATAIGHAGSLEQSTSTTTHIDTTGIPAQNQWQGESDADTDSNTESSLGEDINYAAPEFTGLTTQQISEKLWWAMARSKSLRRKHMQKPVRKARLFFKRSFSRLRQPTGKGKGRYNAMT